MSTRTSYDPGTFCWVDLSTSDLQAAISFYGALFGWEAEVEETPSGGAYATFRLGGMRVAGAFGGKRTEWLSYVSVTDVEATSARADDLGADVIAGPRDVDGLGRVAYLADPQGATFGVWQPGSVHGAQVVNEPFTLTWNDLVCASAQAAIDFYGALFGWTVREGLGDPNVYAVIVNGERTNGGIMAQRDTPAHWRPYFIVEETDAAAGRIEELGGRVIFGPSAVPAGRIAVALDPQGAIFSVFEGEVDD